MRPELALSGGSLFTAMFSDEPVPDIEAAIVMAHPGDEALGASWLMVRLQSRASVYCLTRESHGCPGGLSTEGVPAHVSERTTAIVAAAALAGVPQERCHNLGLTETELAKDLETLVWLTTAAITATPPRVLVTHACEGLNLDHDATSFAVHMAAKLMARCGGAAPLVVEVPGHQGIPDADEPLLALARQAVRIEFGPESRKVKRRMLQCHGDTAITAGEALVSEAYVLAPTGNPLDALAEEDTAYLDAPWYSVAEMRRDGRQVAAALTSAVLASPSRA